MCRTSSNRTPNAILRIFENRTKARNALRKPIIILLRSPNQFGAATSFRRNSPRWPERGARVHKSFHFFFFPRSWPTRPPPPRAGERRYAVRGHCRRCRAVVLDENINNNTNNTRGLRVRIRNGSTSRPFGSRNTHIIRRRRAMYVLLLLLSCTRTDRRAPERFQRVHGGPARRYAQ